MSNAVITATTLGSGGLNSIMTLLADGFLQSKRNKGRILKYVNTDAQFISGPHGTARFILAPSNLTVNDETDGTTGVKDNTAGTSVDVTISSHKSLVFGMSELASALDGGRSLEAQFAGRFASLFNTIESDICALAKTNTTNVISAGATTVTEAIYDTARTSLQVAQVPQDDLVAFWHPHATAFPALANLPNFGQYQITGKINSTVEGHFGSETYWKNAWHNESQSVAVASPGSVLTHYNFMAHKDAILVAMGELPIPAGNLGIDQTNFMDPESGIKFSVQHYWEQATSSEVFKIVSIYGKALGREDWMATILS